VYPAVPGWDLVGEEGGVESGGGEGVWGGRISRVRCWGLGGAMTGVGLHLSAHLAEHRMWLGG